MKKKVNEETAKMMAAVIEKLMRQEKAKEPTTQEVLDKRIASLNKQISELDDNPLLKKQVLLQLRTAMKQRNELLNQEGDA